MGTLTIEEWKIVFCNMISINTHAHKIKPIPAFTRTFNGSIMDELKMETRHLNGDTFETVRFYFRTPEEISGLLKSRRAFFPCITRTYRYDCIPIHWRRILTMGVKDPPADWSKFSNQSVMCVEHINQILLFLS